MAASKVSVSRVCHQSTENVSLLHPGEQIFKKSMFRIFKNNVFRGGGGIRSRQRPRKSSRLSETANVLNYAEKN